MTNDEAIYTLKNTAFLGWSEQAEKVSEAVRMAVEALKRETSGDAIDRQVVIDTLCDWICGVGERCVKTHCQCIRRIEAIPIPSVQPEERTEERTETHACDCVSRQAAIDVLAAMQGRCTSKAALIQNSKIWQQIKDLPSVQPVDKDINVSCKDAISRQGAIDHFKSIADATSMGNKYNEGFVDGLNFAVGHLETMPSVQPDVPDTNVGDMISRQGAMDGGSGK